MPLFENSYKAAAKTEIERKIRELEHRDTVAQKKIDVSDTAAIVTTNIDFSQRVKLISGKEAERYKQRVAAALQVEQLVRTQTGDIVDGYTNPHEQGLNLYSLEEIQAKIKREKAQEAAEQAQTHPKEPQPSHGKGDELERTSPY